MPMCQPGREVPDQKVVTNTLVVEEEWGEMWRAEHETLGKVLFIAYTTPHGARMFKESLPAIERWKSAGLPADQRILTIKHISADTVVPYILVEDTGGPTMREIAKDPTKDFAPTDWVKWFGGLFEGITTATNLNLVPIGISPDTVFYDPNNTVARWRMAPVGPGPGNRTGLIGRGRYTPKELAHVAETSLTQADTYSLTWMLIDILSGTDDTPRIPGAVDSAVSLERLGIELKAGAQSQNGACVDAGTMDKVLKRWLRNDSEKEMKKYLKERKKRGKGAPASRASNTRTVKKQSSSNFGQMAKSISILLLKVGVFVAAMVGGYYGVQRLFHAKETNNTPLGTARLYFKAVVDGNVGEAQKFATGEAVSQTQDLFREVKYMQESHSASKLAQAVPVTQQEGVKGYIGQAVLKGENGDAFMEVFFKLHEQDDKTYKIFYMETKTLTSNSLGL